MDNNPIGALMQNTMESVKNILKVDTVVGDPIYTPDGITLVPISKISVGFGGGGVEFTAKKSGEDRPYGGGNATAVKIDPIGFLVIKEARQDGQRHSSASNTVDRTLIWCLQVMDRVDAFIEKQKK